LSSFVQSDLLPLLELNLVLWLWVWLVPTLVLRFRFLPAGILGGALPGLVLVRAETFTWRILRHELFHVRQMRRWSPLGIWLAQMFSYILRPLGILLTERRWPGLGRRCWCLRRPACRRARGTGAAFRPPRTK